MRSGSIRAHFSPVLAEVAQFLYPLWYRAHGGLPGTNFWDSRGPTLGEPNGRGWGWYWTQRRSQNELVLACFFMTWAEGRSTMPALRMRSLVLLCYQRILWSAISLRLDQSQISFFRPTLPLHLLLQAPDYSHQHHRQQPYHTQCAPPPPPPPPPPPQVYLFYHNPCPCQLCQSLALQRRAL